MQFGSPRGRGGRARSKSTLTPGGRPRRQTQLKIGTRVCNVFAKVKGPFGGRFDNLREGGNGQTRQSLIVTSTDREFEVDGIVMPEGPRSMENQVASDIVDYLFEGQSHCCVAFGDSGSGKTHALFSGDEDDLGLAYGLLKCLNKRRAVQNSSFTLTVSAFEMGPRDKIRDLLAPEGSQRQINILNMDDPHAEELEIEGLTEKVIANNPEGGRIIYEAVSRVPDESVGSTVVRFRLSQYFGTTRKTGTIDVVDLFYEDNCIKRMLPSLRDQDFETAFADSLITRLSMPKLMRNSSHTPAVTFIATVSTKMNEMAETLQTVKMAKDLIDLRKQVQGSPAESGMGTPTAASPAPGGASAFGSPPQTPGMMLMGNGMSPSPHQQQVEDDLQRQMRLMQGKLQATQSLVLRLEKELHEKAKEIRDEKHHRVAAEQETQDMRMRVQVLEEKVKFEADRLADMRTDVRVRDQQLKMQKVENLQMSQEVLQLKFAAKKLSGEKSVVEGELADLREKLEKLISPTPARHSDMILELRVLLHLDGSQSLDVPKPPPPVKKRTVSPKARSRNNTANHTPPRAASANSMSHHTPAQRSHTSTHIRPHRDAASRSGSRNHPKPVYSRAATASYKVPTATRTRSPGSRSVLTNSSPNHGSVERQMSRNAIVIPPLQNASPGKGSPFADLCSPEPNPKHPLYRTRSQERRARSPPPFSDS